MKLDRRQVFAGALAAVAARAVQQGASAQEATPEAPAASLGWSDPLDATDRLNVAATVAPISSIVRNVGGDRIQLRGIVPDGTNSHTFEPAPSDAKYVGAADLIFVNGLNLELPTLELAESNLKEGAEIVLLGDQTVTPDQWVFDFSFPEEDGDPNPHLWTNIPFAKRYAEIVAETLSRRDPDHADYYAGNLARYAEVLDRLDAASLAAIQTIPEQNRKLLTYHDSWAYFAPYAGMTVIGAVQPSDFSEPSPRDMAAIIEQIKAEGVPAIFGSEVFASDVLEQIAKESGAVYVDQLRDDDPPGDPGDPEHTYLGMMLKNFDLMIPALGGNTDALAGIEPWDTWVPFAG
ncbi:MAG: metal ABC transporter substrate-binding protein [Chloroflexota bacterium]